MQDGGVLSQEDDKEPASQRKVAHNYLRRVVRRQRITIPLTYPTVIWSNIQIVLDEVQQYVEVQYTADIKPAKLTKRQGHR